VSLALYRRYRPETFAEIIGQEHVTGPLQQALRSDRVNHAYLFSGPRGCGKTTSARILARALNCEKGPTPEPCGVCDSCLDLSRTGGGSIDVVEIDAASHGGVDDARDLRERAFYAPAGARYKIYIIDEAHMVTPQGFNALLKVVEEPPPHLKFIFATTEPERVLGTIRSRTHHYPFRLVPPRVLQDYLQWLCDSEGAQVGPGVLPMVVRAGAGSVRDALSVLDQLIGGAGPQGVTTAYASALLGYTDAALLDDVVDAFAADDAASVFELVDRVVDSGIDPRRFLADLLERLRDLVILHAVPDAAAKGMLHAPADQVERMAGQAGRFGASELARAADIVSVGLTEMRGATSPRLHLELVCARVLLPAADPQLARGLGARVDRLERRFAIGAAEEPSPQPSAAPRPPRAPMASKPSSPDQPGGDHPVAEGLAAKAPLVEAPPAEVQTPASSPVVPSSDVPGAEAPGAEAPADGVAESAVASAATAAADPPEVTAQIGSGTAGGLDLHAVRGLWPAVLDQVKQRRRVTWMLLFDKVQVLGLGADVLTIGFPDAGSVKGFTSGGHDEVLRQAIIDVVGADWRVDPVHQPGAGPTPGTPAAPAAPLGPTGDRPPARAPVDRAPLAPDAAAPARRGPDHNAGAGEDVPSVDDDADDGDLAGAELVVRELGGRVIGELGGP
jgi:DNA polymerase III subunit gamma/tau